MTSIEERTEVTLHNIAVRLAQRFPHTLPLEQIEQELIAVHDELAQGARVTTHLATLAERTMRERLLARRA